MLNWVSRDPVSFASGDPATMARIFRYWTPAFTSRRAHLRLKKSAGVTRLTRSFSLKNSFRNIFAKRSEIENEAGFAAPAFRRPLRRSPL